MNGQEYIRSMFKEAELYRTQGLLKESRDSYLKVQAFIEKHEPFCKKNDLIQTVENKIRNIEETLAEHDKADEKPDLSQETQGLIKDLFSFSQTKEMAEMEGAMALAKFGLYDQALAEFQRLLEERTLPIMAAKNIIRCHLCLSAPQAAVGQLQQWVLSDVFTKQDLNHLRSFLEDLFKQRGIERELPALGGETAEPEQTSAGSQKDLLDIISIKIPLAMSNHEGEGVEFDVTFQSGNLVRIILAAAQNALADFFKPGSRLPEVQFFSPIAVFRGAGVVSAQKRITHGPGQGDYLLEITIEEADHSFH